MIIEIVSFPIENGGSFHSYVKVYQSVGIPRPPWGWLIAAGTRTSASPAASPWTSPTPPTRTAARLRPGAAASAAGIPLVGLQEFDDFLGEKYGKNGKPSGELT